jgi:phosphatidylethanolamine/phosphatidyl-N-methylethanolamine N-methyltransferase
MHTVESVERIYSRYSGIYDLLFGKIFHSGREQAVEMMDLSLGDRVLEVGVGTGLSLSFYPRNCKVTGIDISEGMLAEAEKKVAEEDLRHVALQKMDALDMEFPDDTFDRVLAAYVVTTVPDPIRLVREIKRVTKPGGRFVLLNHFQSTNPVFGRIEHVISPLTRRVGFRTDLALDDFARMADLSVRLIKSVNLFGHWKMVECVNIK